MICILFELIWVLCCCSCCCFELFVFVLLFEIGSSELHAGLELDRSPNNCLLEQFKISFWKKLIMCVCVWFCAWYIYMWHRWLKRPKCCFPQNWSYQWFNLPNIGAGKKALFNMLKQINRNSYIWHTDKIPDLFFNVQRGEGDGETETVGLNGN